MKKSFILYFVLLFSTIALQAQEIAVTSQDSIIFEKTTHDYGTIAQGGDGNCEFVFTNKGTSPLILTNVQASCGCTVPEWPREPVSPGKSGVIKVAYNTNSPGSFRKSVTVSSTAVNSSVYLVITGNVTPNQ